MDDAIEIEIRHFLPSVEENNFKTRVERIIDLGVTKYSYLNLIEKTDLIDTVKAIQS